MALERSRADLALWADPGAGNGPGTFAVVIGVSRYDHLPVAGGPPLQPPPPHDAYGLGQLSVSALTAYRFFTWLRDQYRYDAAPLAQCWVLLAPTQEELAQEPEMGTYPRATLAECTRVLKAWYASMQGVHPEFLSESRAMFFFSGHGINSGDRQLLLPADWLAPPFFNVNDALSAQNVNGGLWSLPLPEEILFLDACRSRPEKLAGLQLLGQSVLPEVPRSSVDPSRVSPLMWASAAGTEAWQPASPAEGLSLFGGALLEGLKGKVTGDPECVHSLGHVSLTELGRFVNKQVSRRLKRVKQPIRIDNWSDVCVTAPAAPPPQPPAPANGGGGGSDGLGMAGPTGGGGDGGFGMVGTKSAESGLGFDFGADEGAVDVPATLRGGRRADEVEPAEEDAGTWADLPPDGMRPERVGMGDLHGVFGSEHMSGMWHTARALPLDSGNGARAEIVVHAVRVAEDDTWHVVFGVEGEGPHWLELSDGSHTYAVTLPGDAHLRPRYTLDFSRDVDGTFHRVEAGLAPDSPGMLGEMARLWEKYRDLRLREVVSALDARVFEEALRSKLQSPLAAEIAGLFLLRGRKYDRLHDWLGNLAAWHPRRTDGPVLWAEHLRQARASRGVPADQVEQLLEVARRGLPHTAEAVAYLGEQLDEVLRFGELPRQEERTVLTGLHERVSRAMAHFLTGGLFAVYAGPVGSITPELVAGEGVSG
ncbi:MAG TPA: caspase family protein [Longimicrobium sp.]|nr:caspase family protein [Longimicrobium sp.]